MLIDQIVKKQIISILDAIISTQSQLQYQDKNFTCQSFAQLNVQRGILKDEQKQIFLILIDQYLLSQTQNNEFQQENTFTYKEAYIMMKSIKRNMTTENNNRKLQRAQNLQQKQFDEEKKGKFDFSSNLNHNQIQANQLLSDPGNHSKHLSKFKQSAKDKIDPSLGQISKKIKKQNQFITRNINRIKKYATNFDQNFLPLGTTQIQTAKISHEISEKLFHIYKSIYPSCIFNKNQNQLNNFQTKEQYKKTLDYHKIMDMFIDATIKIDIENKLSLLRIIKKFTFNPNFIQLQQWSQIYKAIINNLGVKEILLQRLAKLKEKKNNKISIKISPLQQQSKKLLYRSSRFKTQVSIPEDRLTQHKDNDHQNNQWQSQNNIQNMSSKSSIRPINLKMTMPKSYNQNEHRSCHKKLLTDISKVQIKNVNKETKSEKMIGLEDKNEERIQSQFVLELEKNQYSYLKNAIKNKKVGQITWQSLFEMKQETMHHNIIIPNLSKIRNDNKK